MYRPVTVHKTSISKQDCYARALTIIGHLPRFLILNELNTKKSVIASKTGHYIQQQRSGKNLMVA